MPDTVNVGTMPNARNGAPIREAFQAINVRLQQIAALLNHRGAWATATAYSATDRDWVTEGGQAYIAAVTHTSGVFATDFAAGRWLAVDVAQLILDLSASGSSKGGAMVGFLQAGIGAVDRTVQDKLRERISVMDKGAVPGATDSRAAIQRAFDEHPNAEIDFCGESFTSSGPIYLSDLTGRQFKGGIAGCGGSITFTNAGNATDADADMQHGFSAMATALTAGADNSGVNRISIAGLVVDGPTHGAGFMFSNSSLVEIKGCASQYSRYGVAMDCCIGFTIKGNLFRTNCNAGVGMIRTNDPARVWYTPAGPTVAYWNDSHRIEGNGFASDALNQTLAFILDHGSTSLRGRVIEGNYCFSRWDGIATKISTQYGYLGRNADPVFRGNWFENVNNPIRILNSNAAEGGGNIPGVAGAEPSGTYAMSSLPDGFSYLAIIEANQFARAFQDINVSGVNGTVELGPNLSQQIDNGGTHLVSITGGAQRILDKGDVVINPVGAYAYASLTNPVRTNLAADWIDYVPTVAPTSTPTGFTSTVNAARYLKRGRDVLIRLDITITANGSGANAVGVTLPVTALTAGGVLAGRELTAGSMLQGYCNGTWCAVLTYNNTYPGATGYRFALSGVYESVA